MVAGGPPSSGSGGWIATRPPLDGPSRLRILVGVAAIVVAALSSLALLNLLVVEPVVGEGPGDGGGDVGGGTGPIDGGQTGDPDAGGGADQPGGGEPGAKRNPCTTAKSWVGGTAVTLTVVSLALWVLSVWWRQSRQTRVMNGWAITALVFTLVAVTFLFAWWLITKICNLDVFDLKACRDIANSLRTAFFAFLLPGLGMIGFAVVKKRQGGRFMGLWSGAGFVFVYIAVLALVGWLVADDFCDRTFEPPDDIPDPDDPGGDGGDGGGDGGGGDGGDPDPGGDPGSGDPGDPGQSGGGDSRLGGGGGRSGGGSGGGGLPTLSAPQVSPVMLLVLLGMAAVVVIIVLAARTRHNQAMNLGAGAPEEIAVEDRGTLLKLLERTDLRSDDQVVASYRSYLSWATVRGVGKYPHETPREHGQRVTYELDLPWDETEPLLEAYTHVRLGDEALDERLRRAAVAFAEGIRDGAIRPGRPYAVPADVKPTKPADQEDA